MKWLLPESLWTVTIIQSTKCGYYGILSSCEGTGFDIPMSSFILMFLCSLFWYTNIGEIGLLSIMSREQNHSFVVASQKENTAFPVQSNID